MSFQELRYCIAIARNVLFTSSSTNLQ